MKKVYLIYPDTLGTVAPAVYGHFTEQLGGVFYDGLWVGRDSAVPNLRGFRKSLVEAFRQVRPPVLRWPGGCFAETYDWRDGIGPERPVRRNWWTPNDGRLDPNLVGTHEFCDLCELAGAEPYFAANVTSSTPLEIRAWMDYCLSPRGTTSLALERERNGHPEPWHIPYWGVGNENWGGGGSMTPETYANIFKRYAAVMRNVAPEAKLFACGPNAEDYAWTRQLLRELDSYRDYSANLLDGLSMHYYCGAAGDPLTFTTPEWYEMLEKAGRMDEILNRHWSIVRAWGREAQAKLVIDEWGCWHPDGSGPSHGANLFEQQSTLRDAAVTALTLNIFNNNCDKVQMANCAQLVNNLHCLFFAAGDRFAVTPTYHVFRMFAGHQGGTALRVVTESGALEDSLSVSATEKDGKTLLTVANLSGERETCLELVPVGRAFTGSASGVLLSASDLHAHNTFDAPEAVSPRAISPANGCLTLPAGGIAAVTLEAR